MCSLYLNIMTKYYSSILLGCTLGYLALFPGTAWTNHIASRACQQESDTHTLINVRGFAGDTKYCVANKYL